MSRRPPHRPLRLLVLVGLLASTAACGARWTGEQREEVLARHEGGAAEASASGADGGTGTGTASSGAPGAAAGTGVTGDGGASGAAGGSGGSTDPVASGTGGSGDSGGPLPCAVASDAPGVTDTEITVGSISSLTGPVPGLGSSAAAATRAYVAYRNSAGGVCGRQIVLREADDGTDNGRYRSVVTDLGPQVFGVVGGFALGDVGGADIVAQQGLPVINTPSGEAASAGPTLFDINPGFDDPHAAIGKYRYLLEQGATTVAIAYLAVDQSRFEANLQRGLMEAAGIEVALQLELPLSTLSYDSTARAIANSGADYLWFIADVNGEAAMARAMADTGYELQFAEYFTFAYGTSFTELAGDAADGTVAFIRSLPNEEAASNAELAAFIEWMGQTSPGDDLDAFAVDSWASAKAFFDSLEALPGPITREAFLAQLQAVETFDAGGMFGPIRLGAERTNGCVVGMRFQGGTWRRFAPAQGFLC